MLVSAVVASHVPAAHKEQQQQRWWEQQFLWDRHPASCMLVHTCMPTSGLAMKYVIKPCTKR